MLYITTNFPFIHYEPINYITHGKIQFHKLIQKRLKILRLDTGVIT